jgi:hypothetical protein
MAGIVSKSLTITLPGVFFAPVRKPSVLQINLALSIERSILTLRQIRPMGGWVRLAGWEIARWCLHAAR